MKSLYTKKQIMCTSANLSLSQNLDFKGGTSFIDTEFDYLLNINQNEHGQFSTVLFHYGYSQSLIGTFLTSRYILKVEFEKFNCWFI